MARTSAASPRIVPAGGDTQHPAHRGYPVDGPVRSHELEDLPGTIPVSRANQAAALFRICLPSTDKKVAIPALREAGDSPDAAAATPRARHSSDRPRDDLHRDWPDAPSCGSPATSIRTVYLRQTTKPLFASQLPGRATRPHQLHHLATVLRRVRRMSFCHPDTSSAQWSGVHKIGATSPGPGCWAAALPSSCNTNAPTIMIGEKASDLILGREPLPPSVPETGWRIAEAGYRGVEPPGNRGRWRSIAAISPRTGRRGATGRTDGLPHRPVGRPLSGGLHVFATLRARGR